MHSKFNNLPEPWQNRQSQPITLNEHIDCSDCPREDTPPNACRDEVLSRVEAVLFSADEPLTPRKLARLANLADTGEARRQVSRLNDVLNQTESAFEVAEVAGGYQMLTCADLRSLVEQVYRPSDELQLSTPTLETLAIVAYRQPIGRADIEAIRGVQIGEILKQLMDKGLVKFAGKDDSLGRPYLYGTTKRFLETFGLRNLNELPLVEVLKDPGAKIKEPQETTTPTSEPAGVEESS